MPTITFTHSNKTVEANLEDWLYDVADAAESGIPFSCKAGACGTCATEVIEGRENLGEQTAREVRTLTSSRLDPAVYRLPCLCDVHGDVTFGAPANAKEQAASLNVQEVVVESYRPLNATVAEVRFFVETPEANLSAGMQHYNSSYTGYFNRRHSRVGHLFQVNRRIIFVTKQVLGENSNNSIPLYRI